MSTPEIPAINWYEPRVVVAGDTASWQLLLGNYPPPDWTLSYSLRGSGQGMYINFSEVNPSPNGQQHLIQQLPVATIGWIPGLYKFQSYVTNSVTTDRITIGWGEMTVAPNLSADDPADPRSYVRRTRDILAAAMEGRLPQGMEHYSIAGRSISKISITQLNALWREYEGYVQDEERAEMIRKGRRDPRLIRGAFTYIGGVYPPQGLRR
jgi:hypothetical protein